MKIFYGLDKVKFIPYVENMCWSFKMLRYRKKPLYAEANGEKIFCKGLFLEDSAGFTELSEHGRYSFNITEYIQNVKTFAPDLFASMDWMCEPSILQKTGLTVKEHIRRTVENSQEIITKYPELEGRFLPVIQGWEIKEYLECIDLYEKLGIIQPYMAIGSICRRGSPKLISKVIMIIKDRLPKVRLHGFGIKLSSLNYLSSNALASIDTMAWTHTETGDLTPRERVLCIYDEKSGIKIRKRASQKEIEHFISGDHKDYRWQNLCRDL